jgi:Uma2 family endonuclease
MSRSATVRAPSTGLTAAEFAARAGEFEHCELLHGEVVPRAPTKRRHGRTEVRLGRFLDEYIERRGAGELARLFPPPEPPAEPEERS